MILVKGAVTVLSVIVVTAVAPSVAAQFVQEHVIAVESSTPASAKEFLQGNKGPSVQLAGQLRLAKDGPKQPLVVLLPGAGGIGASNHTSNEWARVLNEAGLSTFVLDSFTGRKRFVIGEHATLPPIVRVVDAFAALKVLSEHPFVDNGKISVMGFSHGSAGTMYSNTARFHKLYGNGLKFASHISVYGLCATRYRGDEDLISPMLILHGDADDWVPAAPCVDYAERLKKGGKDVQIITYPDAHHVFDSVYVGPVKKMDFTTAAGCRQEETDAGDIVSVQHRSPSRKRTRAELRAFREATTKQQQRRPT